MTQEERTEILKKFIKDNNIASTAYKGIIVGVIEGKMTYELPDEIFVCSMRHASSDWTRPVTIELRVFVDRWGHLLCDRNLFEHIGIPIPPEPRPGDVCINLSKKDSQRFADTVIQWEMNQEDE